MAKQTPAPKKPEAKKTIDPAACAGRLSVIVAKLKRFRDGPPFDNAMRELEELAAEMADTD